MTSGARRLVSGRWLLRGLVFAAVFAMGLTGLVAGVGLSERDGVPQASLAAKVYYTFGLFVFGGLDLGVPVGGPDWARTLLWLAFFGAPAVTTTALVEGFVYVFRPTAWRLWWMRDHVVIGGCGRLALLRLEQLREKSPRQQVLLVERNVDNPNVQAVSERPRVHVLFGDVSNEAVLESLALSRARGVYLLTGNDYANLDAASRIRRIRPALAAKTEVHVSDLRLKRVIDKTELWEETRVFNSYETAAEHLVGNTLLPHFELTEDLPDTVVIAGFGRFGQTVLDHLQRQEEQQREPGLFQTVVLIDLAARIRVQVFAEQVGFAATYTHHVIEGDLQHPATWSEAEPYLREARTRPVVVIGTGVDGVNIRSAMWLSGELADARIVARCFDQTSFTEQISRKCGFEIVSTADLLQKSMSR